jgi:hypothetical protein
VNDVGESETESLGYFVCSDEVVGIDFVGHQKILLIGLHTTVHISMVYTTVYNHYRLLGKDCL